MATDESMLKVVLRFADRYVAEFDRRIAALEATVERLTDERRLDELARVRRKLGQYEISRAQLLACAQSVQASLASEAAPVEPLRTLALTLPDEP